MRGEGKKRALPIGSFKIKKGRTTEREKKVSNEGAGRGTFDPTVEHGV